MKRIVASLIGLMVMGGVYGCAGGPGGGAKSSKNGDKFAVDQLKCSAKNHERPFIIEWDATDMSSFESRASNDVIVVHYEGCELKVLDKCNDDSLRGSVGSYKSVEWTSGSLEKLDVASENELYAKLPLGVASLGGRVSSGEKFHMEYYVAGTRTATRDKLYRSDLDKIPGCKGATHFVYNYNLGAFALGNSSETNVSADGSLYGFGAGASNKSSRSAEKKGGDLGTCKGDSAKEIEGCKIPIRLTLREIADGDNPDVAASTTADTDASLNAAAKINAKLEMSGKAQEYYEAAAAKANAKDGKSCLKELDNHDKADAKHMSTDPKSGFGYLRAQCLMLSGQCDAGKQLFRKTQEAKAGGQMSPEMIDRGVEAQAGLYCQGGSMKPRDQLIKAMTDLQQGAFINKKDVATCQNALATVKQLKGTVKITDDEENPLLKDIDRTLPNLGANCLAKAGDCNASFKFFSEESAKGPGMDKSDAKTRGMIIKSMFKSLVQVPKCKDLAKMAAGEGPCQADADCTSGKCDKSKGVGVCN